MRTVYLDTSSLVKRYVKESGSEAVDRLFQGAERETLLLMFSIWNIGEMFGTIDKKQRRGHIPPGSLRPVLQGFIDESRKMNRLNTLKIQPIDIDTLTESWFLTLRHQVFVGDALQIATAAIKRADLLITADSKLGEAAIREGLDTLNVETEGEKIWTWIGE